MFSFSVRTLQNAIGSPRSVGSPTTTTKTLASQTSFTASPKVDVGEIDTRAPFESVKAAVSLFGDVVTPKARPVTKKTRKEEQRLLEKEAQHHMVLRKLEQYKDQLRMLECDKGLAQRDLQVANRTVQDLTNKLEILSESKQAVITATEAAKTRTRELEEQKSIKDELGSSGGWKRDVDSERELYKASSSELISCKQELTNLRQDFDTALEAKLAAFRRAQDARNSARANHETRKHLMNEVAKLRVTLGQVKKESVHAEEEHLRLIAEKEVHFLVHKSAQDAAEKEIRRLKEEHNTEENLELKLEEASEAVKVFQDQLNDVRKADMDALQALLTEVENAKKEQRETIAEHELTRSSVYKIIQEIKEVKRMARESEKSAVEVESRFEGLREEVYRKKFEVETGRSRNVTGEMQASLIKFLAKAEKDKQEMDRIIKDIGVLRREAEAATIASREADEKLKIAVKEAEEAKAAEKWANDQIHASPRSNSDGNNGKDQGPVRKIRLSVDEFRSMTQKIEDCREEADVKVAKMTAQLQSVQANEKEALRKLEGMLKEREEIESEIKEYMAEAEAAAGVLEGDLRQHSFGGRTPLI